MNDQEYTKHYYIEGERVCSKIGSGFGLAPYDPLGEPVNVLSGAFSELPDSLLTMVQRSAICAGYEGDITISGELKPAHNAESDPENDQYFYHPDHLGSSSYITDLYGNGIQHLQYLPFGENFVDQQTGVWNTPYKFSGKEKDDETGYSYFGARYYDSDLSVWLSVDPMAGKYPSLSPYAYCAGNPLIFMDPDGNKIRPVNAKANKAMDNKSMKYGQLLRIPNPTQDNVYSTERYFSSRKEFNEAFKSELKKSDCNFSKNDMEEAWSFYEALSDPSIIEVSVFETSDEFSQDFSYNYNNSENNGSKLIGDGLMTENSEYEKFVEILKYAGGTVLKDIAEALYKGKEIKANNKSYSISPDRSGEGWVFFNNNEGGNKVKGHLVIDGTGKNSENISTQMINALKQLKQ